MSMSIQDIEQEIYYAKIAIETAKEDKILEEIEIALEYDLDSVDIGDGIYMDIKDACEVYGVEYVKPKSYKKEIA